MKTEIRLTKTMVFHMVLLIIRAADLQQKFLRELDEIPAFVLFEMVIIAVIAYALYVLTGISDILWAFSLPYLHVNWDY